MKKLVMAASLAALGVTLAAAPAANAAALYICDSPTCGTADPNLSFNTNDFEYGFTVNNTLVQQGLHHSNSTVVSETAGVNPAMNTFTGTWILGHAITAQDETVFFTEGLGLISDVLHYQYSMDNSGRGHLTGFIMSDASEAGIDPTFLSGQGIVATQTMAESTNAYNFSNTNISAYFRSDVDVPEPASLGLVGLGLATLAGLGLRRRRRS